MPTPHVDARDEVLAGKLIQDSPAGLRVSAAEDEVDTHKCKRNGFINNIARQHFQAGVGIDAPDVGCSHIDLQGSDVSRPGPDEPVQIGFFDLVRVDQE
jgi:hypothetical protein